MRATELLAPAGDFESLLAAINNGADAVYLGMGDFNARASASNFTKETIGGAVRRAHLFGVKVYVTFNTLIKNSEVEGLIDAVGSAIDAKADGFIVQDIGVATILKECFPGIRLHASTQAGIHNAYGAAIAEKVGFKRAVLSRETKLADIKDIASKSTLDLEFFVQGALCVSFSGNCYMSALENDKSGNRGRCLQLCRLPYGAMQDKKSGDQYLLSTSDLCLIDNLKTLTDAGISSFKIEGRLRRGGYVAEATDCYRQAIDEGMPSSNAEKIERLKKVFFRGDYITGAYLDKGVPDRIINKQHQNHIGLPIGKVTDVKKFKDIFAITIASSHTPAKGDGIKFFEGNKQIGSLGVGNVDALGGNLYRIFGKAKPAVGAKVNLILDRAAEDKALVRVKRLGIRLKISAIEGAPLQIIAEYGKISAKAQSDYIVQKAQSSPTAPNEIIAQVAKTADSPFCIERTEIEADGVFLPKSVINEVRRNLFATLENNIVAAANQNIRVSGDDAAIKRIKAKAAAYATAKSQPANAYLGLEDGGGRFERDKIAVLYPQVYDTETLSGLVKDAQAAGYAPCLRLPTIANQDDIRLIERLLADVPEIKKLFINNLYGLHFAQKSYEIIAGWGLNVYNNFAADTLFALGVQKIVASVEPQEMQFSDNIYRFEGKGLPVMTLAHCPYKMLYGRGCGGCSYKPGLSYTRQRRVYNVVRHKASQCYFELVQT